MDPINFYLKDIYQKSNGYRATWLPDKPLKLGQIGKITDNVFTSFSSLEEKGINILKDSNDEEGSFDLSSENGVKVTSKIKGKVEPKAVNLLEADAGFIVEFEKNNSFVFRLKDIKTTIITNLEDVQKRVADLYNKGEWDTDYVIITELLEARSSTILISGNGGVKIELKINGAVSVPNLDIADSSLDIGWASGQKLAAQIIAKSSTPLYKVVGLNKKLFGKKILIAKGVSPEVEALEILEIIEMEDSESQDT